MADLDRINDLIRAARANWFGLLAYLAFVGVTLMGVHDADFFIPERETTLPLIGVDIPTFLFFWVAPALGAALYAYLHLNLLRLWEAVGDHLRQPDLPLWRAAGAEAPAMTAAPLVNRTVPWLVTDHALAGTPQGPPADRPLRRLADLVTWALTYAAAPLILAAFFWRSMPAHDEALTVIGCALPLWVALYASLTSARHRRACLTGQPPRRWRTRAVLWPAAIALPLLGWLTTEGTIDHYARTWFGMSDEKIAALPVRGTEALLVPANLAGVDFVGIPDGWRDFDTARKAYRIDWCRSHDLPRAVCGAAGFGEPSEELTLRRLAWCRDVPAPTPDETTETEACTARFAAFEDEFNADWKTERKAQLGTLTQRTLARRDFRGADLRGARLEGADLNSTRFIRADLRQAWLEGANLNCAWLERADLLTARMEGANLEKARLDGADIRRARLDGAVFLFAHLTQVRLSEASLRGTDFRGARLDWANLSESLLEGTDLRGAGLEWANLSDAMLSETTLFKPATLRGAGLSNLSLQVAITSNSASPNGETTVQERALADLLSEAFGDASVVLPSPLKAGEPPLEHWSTRIERKGYYGAWRAYQRALGYTPVELSEGSKFSFSRPLNSAATTPGPPAAPDRCGRRARSRRGCPRRGRGGAGPAAGARRPRARCPVRPQAAGG